MTYYIQDVGDGLGLDVLVSQGDDDQVLVLSGARAQEVVDLLGGLDADERVVVFQGALDRVEDEESNAFDLMVEIRDERT